MRVLLVLVSAMAVFAAFGGEALAARAKKKATKKPAHKSAPRATPSSKASPSAKAAPAVAEDPAEAATQPSPVQDSPVAAPESAAAVSSAPAEPAPPAHTIAIIIEGTNARELDKALRNGLAASVGLASASIVAESVTIADQQVFDRPKNKREVVKAARKVSKRAKVDGVIYANIGGSTSKGYSAAILFVYKNGKVGIDATVPVSRSVRQGKRTVLKWQYANAVAVIQPGLDGFPPTQAEPSATEPAPEQQQTLGDAMAAFDSERGDEPVLIDSGEVVATVPETVNELYLRRINSPIIVKVGIEGGHRSFAYNQPVTANLRDYSVGFVPLIKFEGEFYPFGTTAIKALRGIGWYASYERAFNVQSSFQTSDDNIKITNTWTAWQVGMHTRFNVTDNLSLGPQATYGFFEYRFGFDNIADQRALEVPDVRYNFLRLGLEARVPFFIFDLAGGAGYNDILSGGRVANQYFPNSSTRGVDAYLTLGYPLSKHFAIDGTVRYNRYFYSLKPELGDTYVAGGATDQYFMASINLAYIWNASNDQ